MLILRLSVFFSVCIHLARNFLIKRVYNRPNLGGNRIVTWATVSRPSVVGETNGGHQSRKIAEDKKQRFIHPQVCPENHIIYF